MTELVVEMVSRSERFVVASNGLLYPITHFFDADGDECGPDEAVTAVAGCGNTWFTVLLTQYRPRVLH